MSAPRTTTSAIGTGLLSALFFTLTYVLNRGMAVAGGHWAWSSSLRYFITLPILLAILPSQGGLGPLWREMRRHSVVWLLWGTVGFGVFYVGLTYAAASGPSWLIASTFQLTIVAGLLLSPFIYRDARRRIPLRALGVGGVIIVGVLLTQLAHAKGSLDRAGWIALGSVIVAAFTYPLGNRMILLHLERAGVELSATQRVTGMTLACQPFWLLVAAHGAREAGLPSWSQVASAGGVALSAGVIATILFFRATAMVRLEPTALAAVEAMQAGEIVFATLIGVLCLGEPWPGRVAVFGVLLVIGGIVAFSRISAEPAVVGAHAKVG